MRRPEPALLRLLVFFGSLGAVLFLLIHFRQIFLPLLLGLGLAYILDPAVTALAARGVKRSLGTVIVGVGALLVVAIGVGVIVPGLIDQVHRVGDRLPGYVARLRAQLTPWLASLEARYPEEFARVSGQIDSTLRSNLPRILQTAGGWITGLFQSLLGFLLFLLNLIFVPVFAFYLLVDFPKLKSALFELIPLPYRPTVTARLGEVDEAVSSFLRGQLTIAIILAVINAVGLTAIGVPLGLGLGIIAGLANMVPYMSLIIGLAPALLLSWAEHQSLTRLLLVIAVFSAGNLLEGTVLSPRILGRSVNLHPVWILLAIIIGGSLFGIFGMLLAVPVAATVQVFARHWVIAYKSSLVYRGDENADGRPDDAGATPATAPAAAASATPTVPAPAPPPARRRR